LNGLMMASIFFMSGLLSVRAAARGVIPARPRASTVPSARGQHRRVPARLVCTIAAAILITI
jgi:hypothetical protein